MESSLAGRVVLVVEDEPLVGLDVVEMLTAAGAHAVSANRAGEAIATIDRLRITAAVLDINLGDGDCATICKHLWERGIPFLFHTGYNAPLASWSHVPVVRKPAVPQDMLDAVERLCGSLQTESHHERA